MNNNGRLLRMQAGLGALLPAMCCAMARTIFLHWRIGAPMQVAQQVAGVAAQRCLVAALFGECFKRRRARTK